MKKVTALMFCILFAVIIFKPITTFGQGIYSPGGYGVSGKTVYGGLVGNFTKPFKKESEVALTIGVGLGDAVKGVGFQIESSMLNTSNQLLYSAGIVAHRVLQKGVSMAFGFNNLISFATESNSNTSNINQSAYFAITHALGYKYPSNFIGKFTYSIGVGLGRYSRLSISDISDNGRSKGTIAFGALQFAATKNISLHTEWSGTNLNAAVSTNARLYNVPFSVIFGYTDLIKYSGDGARFMSGIGFSYNFININGDSETAKMLNILENQERQELDALLKSAK